MNEITISRGVDYLMERRPAWTYIWPLSKAWEDGFATGFVMGDSGDYPVK